MAIDSFLYGVGHRTRLPRHLATLAVVLALTACHPASSGDSAGVPAVTLGQEVLEGIYEDTGGRVASFRGIAYAAPPVGALRWQAPAAAAPRTDRVAARSFAPACYQDSGNTDWYRRVAKPFGVDPKNFNEPPYSEDCLYLNVWTPTPDAAAKLPVMVWIHGGGNENGWSYEPNYQGARLAAQGHVVVVTIAYRLNVFGFFGHPELSRTPSPANFGLLDQIAALQWVRDHIETFGGDATNVTVFGESAGAADVGYLISSPKADGLFRRAIAQSGGYLMLSARGLKDAEQDGLKLAGAFAERPDLAALRAKSSAEILSAAKSVLARNDYGPVIDGSTLTMSPAASFRRNGVPVDLLAGSNQNEDFMYVADDAEALRGEVAELPAAVRPLLAAEVNRIPSVRLARDRLWTLTNMQCPPYLMAVRAATGGHRSWISHFSRTRTGPGGAELMVYHGSEIPYVFDSHDNWLPTEEVDRALTRAMLAYWTNFARSGDPNGPGLTRWPAVVRPSPQVLDLGTQITAFAAPDRELCDKVAPALYPGWAP